MASIDWKDAEKVETKEDFFKFLKATEQDRIDAEAEEKNTPSNSYGPGHNDWQNGSISKFLEAMHGFGIDSNLVQEPSWKSFAQLIIAGKKYE